MESEALDPTAVTFGAFEILKVFSISAAARRMTVPAFESYIVTELGECVAETIGYSLVNGTGEAQGTGVLPGIVWTDDENVFTFPLEGAPAYTDFTNLMAKLKRGYAAGAKFAMSNATLYSLVYSIVDKQDRPIFITDPKNEGIGYILGRPVVIDDNLPDDVILLGNFQYMAYNIPEGIVIEASRESSFKSALVDYRAMAIAPKS